jgi:hypothetical protein
MQPQREERKTLSAQCSCVFLGGVGEILANRRRRRTSGSHDALVLEIAPAWKRRGERRPAKQAGGRRYLQISRRKELGRPIPKPIPVVVLKTPVLSYGHDTITEVELY